MQHFKKSPKVIKKEIPKKVSLFQTNLKLGKRKIYVIEHNKDSSNNYNKTYLPTQTKRKGSMKVNLRDSIV